MVHARPGEGVKLLVVASDEREFRGVLEHAELAGALVGSHGLGSRIGGDESRDDSRLSRPDSLRHDHGECSRECQPVDWTRRAKLGEHELLLVANGAGPARAAAAVDRTVESFAPEAIVSIGFCGALDEGLDLAAVVVGTEVTGANGRFAARAPAASLKHHLGVVVTIDHVAQSAAEKHSLRQSGASAVDMEAAAVAERSVALGLPFFCIKAVTDLAGEDMANDLNAAMRSDGHFDTMKVLGSIFCRPLVRLPELLRLRGRAVRAACALGDFFADCRF
jgi:nucleoside phosphorylase